MLDRADLPHLGPAVSYGRIVTVTRHRRAPSSFPPGFPHQDTRPPLRGPGSSVASYLLLIQPDVLEAAIHPLAGLWRVVTYLSRAHLQPCVPQPLDAPDLL